MMTFPAKNIMKHVSKNKYIKLYFLIIILLFLPLLCSSNLYASNSASNDPNNELESDNILLDEELNPSIDSNTNRIFNIELSTGGRVILNEGLDNELTLIAEDDNGTKKINVYNNEKILIDIIESDSLIKDSNANYSYKTIDFDVIDIKAIADDGYNIYDFNVNNEVIDFIPNQHSFQHTTIMDSDKFLNIVFLKAYDSEKNKNDENIYDTTNKLSITNDINKNLLESNASNNNYIESNINLCNISACEIKEINDGTVPFDENDNKGNDSSDKNGIVRSFDTINYTINYTTAIKDSYVQDIDSANLMIDFTLPCSPIKASFNNDTTKWISDKQIEYYYEDGSTSQLYDKSKIVVSQKLTGKRHLVNNVSGVIVPGAGTLEIGVNVNAAVSGDIISPKFTIWMEGNSNNEKKTMSSNTLVSSAPKFDIEVKRNRYSNILGYYNTENNTAKLSNPDTNDKYGRLQSYIVTLAIQNDYKEKGMKGLEYPDGSDITFDLKMSELVNGEDVSKQESYDPILWDYKMDNGVSECGKLGRPIGPFDQSIASYGNWTTNTPYNKGNSESRCYNGGDMILTEDNDDNNLLHVTLSGYEMDIEDFNFPIRYSGAEPGQATIPKNTGYFSVGFFQTLSIFNKDVSDIENIEINFEASNLNVKSLSGISETSEVLLDNNKSSVKVTTYPVGTFSKRNFFNTLKGHPLRSSFWHTGDSYAYIGEQILLNGEMNYSGDNYVSAVNILQKFDDEAFSIPERTNSYTSYDCKNKTSIVRNINTFFAAKPNKTGWTSDDEMNNTSEEQLIYFKNIDDLINSGYTCVGMLYEVRNSELKSVNDGGATIEFFQKLNIKKNAVKNNVYMTTNQVRAWINNTDYSYLNVVYDKNINAYGIGDLNWDKNTYDTNYTTPTFRGDLTYDKAVYENGVMVSGHKNGYSGGNSLLIIGNEANIDVNVYDITGNNHKNIYDLDMGERTINITLEPSTSIDSANSEIGTIDTTDDLVITTTLPKGLHFNSRGVSIEPQNITKNEDGTTTIIWNLNEIPVGKEIKPIKYSATIGDVGTINDVSHNDNFVINAKITSKNDTRAVSLKNGNYSETQISVIKLATSSVSKIAKTQFVEISEPITYKLRYSNISGNNEQQVRIYDIFPHNKDERGSNFGGSYDLKNVCVNFSNAINTYNQNKQKIKAYISQTEQNTTIMDDIIKSNSITESFKIISNPKINDSTYEIKWEDIEIKDAKSLYMQIENVFENEYVDIYITLQPKNVESSKQRAKNIYNNNFVQYSDSQSSTVTSNIASAHVVLRYISGYAWLDENKNGIKNSNEKCLQNISASIYRVSPSKHDIDKNQILIDGLNPLFTAYNVYGEPMKKLITDENGYYRFNHLEEGEYIIIFDGIKAGDITKPNNIANESIDSDAINKNENIIINHLVLPSAINMIELNYKCRHNNIGLITDIYPTPTPQIEHIVEISKLDSVTKNLIGGAHLSIYNENNVLNGIPLDSATPIIEWVSVKGEKKQIHCALKNGDKYVLLESKAPDGYKIAEPCYFTATSNNLIKITMYDEPINQEKKIGIKKVDINGKIIGGAKLQIKGKPYNHVTDIKPIEWISEEGVKHELDLPAGIYTLHELEAPAGFLKAKDILFTVDENKNIFIDGVQKSEITMTDIQIKPCNIKIKKLNHNQEAISDVVFSLKFVKPKYPQLSNIEGYNRLLKPEEEIEFRTNLNGEVVFENLDHGEYILSEIKTSENKQLISECISINLPLTMTHEEAMQNNNINISEADYFDNYYHFYELSYDIVNNTVFDIPKTGSSGFWKYGFIGYVSIIMLTVSCFMSIFKIKNWNSR